MKQTIYLFLSVLFTLNSFSQNIEVSGTVIDKEDKTSIPGVNVVVENTTTGTLTDFDGVFTLQNVSSNANLIFSSLGYVTQVVPVNSTTTFNIVLSQNVDKLDEVVVIGYGTQTKKEVTGAVAIISSEAIEKLKPTRIEQALQGQVAGVNITTTSGSPGASSSIRIRGVSTNGDNQPLILVDGNRIEDLSVINPSDIESINVLKDATAGIYGVQAANGVIIITTKSGRKNADFKFTFIFYFIYISYPKLLKVILLSHE